eukprot:3098116-Rhodomonas_salina.2
MNGHANQAANSNGHHHTTNGNQHAAAGRPPEHSGSTSEAHVPPRRSWLGNCCACFPIGKKAAREANHIHTNRNGNGNESPPRVDATCGFSSSVPNGNGSKSAVDLQNVPLTPQPSQNSSQHTSTHNLSQQNLAERNPREVRARWLMQKGSSRDDAAFRSCSLLDAPCLLFSHLRCFRSAHADALVQMLAEDSSQRFEELKRGGGGGEER